MRNKINLVFQQGGLQRLVISANIRTCINAVLKAEGVTAKCEINVLVTDDAGIREINRTSRNIDSATDVLSFPMFELAPGELPADWTEYEDPDTGLVPLGGYVHLPGTGNRPGQGIRPHHPPGGGLPDHPLHAASSGL